MELAHYIISHDGHKVGHPPDQLNFTTFFVVIVKGPLQPEVLGFWQKHEIQSRD